MKLHEIFMLEETPSGFNPKYETDAKCTSFSINKNKVPQRYKQDVISVPLVFKENELDKYVAEILLEYTKVYKISVFDSFEEGLERAKTHFIYDDLPNPISIWKNVNKNELEIYEIMEEDGAFHHPLIPENTYFVPTHPEFLGVSVRANGQCGTALLNPKGLFVFRVKNPLYSQ